MPVKATPERFTGTFSLEQTKQLLLPINPRRVLQANGHSHVPGHDVIAHLIRVFGFGNFTYELVEEPTLIFETLRPYDTTATVEVGYGNNKRTIKMGEAPWLWRYDVCYRAMMRLMVFDEDHNLACLYEDSSAGDASNQTRADGHDLALKSAITLAKKRCAVHLGDQFGLSLYNKGSQNAQVIKSKVVPTALAKEWAEETAEHLADNPAADVSEGVEEQRSLGVDEYEKGTPESTPEQEAQIAASTGARVNEEAK